MRPRVLSARLIGASSLLLLGLLLPSTGALGIAPEPPVTYAVGDLSLQNGWDGGIDGQGFTNNNADSNVVTADAAFDGTHSWRYSGSYNSPGSGTPFTPYVASVGAPNAATAFGGGMDSPVTPDGDESVISFAFKAVAPGDGSRINIYEGNRDAVDPGRTGTNLYLETTTPTEVRLYNFHLSSTNQCANQDFPQSTIATVAANEWHTVKMTTTYGDVTPADLSTYGTTTYVIDEGTEDEVTVTDPNAVWVHQFNYCNSTQYSPGTSIKWANSFNDYPTHQGFYVDDVSMRVVDTETDTTIANFATGFEANYPGTRYVATTGSDASNTCLSSSTPCATVQHAVDQAFDGDTVDVAAGTYTGDVNINKSVILVGAQQGVDPNDGSWNDTRTNAAAESVIHGAVNLSLRNDISFDGFTLERTASNVGHILIGSGNPTGAGATSSFDIKNNRFVGTGANLTGVWAGIHTNFLNDSSNLLPGNKFTATQNRFQISGAGSGAGILVNGNRPGSDGLGSTTITDNYVTGSPSNGLNVNRPGASLTLTGNHLVTDDIFTFQIHNALISDNTVINSPQGSIQVVASDFEDSSNVTVSDNTITNDASLITNNFSQLDIRGPLSGTNVVSGNSVTMSGTTTAPAVAIYGLRIRNTDATMVDEFGNLTVSANTLNGGGIGGAGNANVPPTSGVFVDSDLLTSSLDLRVENNFINGWVNGVSVWDTNGTGPGAFGGLATGATAEFFENDLSGNSGLSVASGTGEIVDASANWWGSNVEATVNAGMTGPVDFTPYLDSGTDTEVDPGFQGDFSLLNVTSLGSQSGATGRIQEAVDLVDGSTVNVLDGTYDEQVVIDESLTLQGQGDNTIIAPSSEAKLTSIYTTGTQAAANFNGMKIASVIDVHGVGVDGVTVTNLKVDAEDVTALPAGADWVAGISYGETGGTIENVTVEDTKFVSPASVRTYGIWVDAVGNTALSVDVTNSTVAQYGRNGVNGRGDDLTINVTDNTITGPGMVGPSQVPNGVLLINGTLGTVSGNTITANHYTGTSWLASGVLLFQAGDNVQVTDNDISDSDDAVILNATDLATVSGNDLSNNAKGVRVEAGSAANNTITNNTIDNNSLFGIELSNTVGTGNTAFRNSIAGNATGVSNLSTNLFDAECNWWGAADGPSGQGSGSGDSVSTEVDFEPWLESATLTGSCTGVPVCATAPFTDVAVDHPFCAEIQWVKDQGISTGFDDGTFRPALDVTRQAMSAFLARLAGATLAPCATPPFSDVPIDHPFCEEIQWMKDEGISTGFDDGTYRPALDVTRQAMSAFLARLAGATLTACTTPPFADVAINHPFCEEIQWMKENGISAGFEDGTFRPALDVTRQAMAAFLVRVSPLLA